MPEHRDESVTHQPPTSAQDYFELRRRALGELLGLSAKTVEPAEVEIEQRYQRARTQAEGRLEEVTADIKSHLQEKVEATARAHADRVEQIQSEYESARDRLARQTKEWLERVAAEFSETEREARRQKDDNLLIAETVPQATIKGLHQELQSVQRQVTSGHQQLESLQSRAQRLLQDYRHEPERDSVAGAADASASGDAGAAYEDLAKTARQHLKTLQRLSTPRLFVGVRPYGLLILLCAVPVGAMGALSLLETPYAPPFLISGPVAFVVTLVVGLLVGGALWRKAHVRIEQEYEPLRRALAAAGRALDRRLKRVEEQTRRGEASAIEKRDRETRTVRSQFDAAIAEAQQRRAMSLQRVEDARSKREAEIEQRRESASREADNEKERRRLKLQERHDRDLAAARQDYEQQLDQSRGQHDSARAALEAHWKAGLSDMQRLLEETDRLDLQPRFDWNDETLSDWTPPDKFAALIPFGHWHLDLTRLAASVREHAGFLADRSPAVLMPALLALPNRCSLFLQSERAGRQEAIDTLRAVMLRLLMSLPPGRVRFTIIDPVGLGENFAGFMHLVDYEEALVGGRIWTESEHIEARLTELTSHMETVIQKYLRNEFETIDAYNQQAGELAEPYRFLVVADFPANFNEAAVHRLSSIVSSGARCGVFTLIAHDKRLPTPPELQIEDLAGGSIHLVYEGERFVYQDELLRQFPLTLDAPPSEEVLTRVMHAVGRGAKDSLRVEVPFESIAPSAEQCWTGDAGAGLSVPLGHTGAVRLQHLQIGRGIAQHTLIAGKTGSGKSTLLHVVISNLALWYSPAEVEFYLVDFKKGVEFKTYVTHQLPHARAIAIESDREFGVSVLQRLDAEMARRGDLFRAAGVQDLPAYREVSGQVLPRTLLIVDEFQVFFTEDDRLSQEAAILLDRLVRQGRAFGIHVLLGSQTLGGTASLARSTIGQMAVRIALQCSEADSQLILDDTNVAARLLSRPGEAIYNDAGGLVEGNSPFQTAWLPDNRRNVYLTRVRTLARERHVRHEPPIVFEGNAPADIRQNRILARLLEAPDWPAPPTAAQAWLGEAVAIKDPTNVTFRRQSGANLLLVGQRDDVALAMMAAAMLCLGAQHAPQAARFIVLDAGSHAHGPPGATVGGEAGASGRGQGRRGLHDVVARLPHETRFVRWRDVGAAIADLAGEMQRRLEADETDAPAVYVLIYGLQRYRMLRRQEEDFSFSTDDQDKSPSTDKQFAELLRDGPPFGVHVLAWSDTLATVERTLDRQSLGEFDNRVLFQMGAADSSNLIDTPDANKLGFYRALLYSEEHGLLEKFRPYAAFDTSWLEHVGQCFASKAAPPEPDARLT
jgi:S-DNA-T family DNA segregation ATPase FtsK/SpoIIIE